MVKMIIVSILTSPPRHGMEPMDSLPVSPPTKISWDENSAEVRDGDKGPGVSVKIWGLGMVGVFLDAIWICI